MKRADFDALYDHLCREPETTFRFWSALGAHFCWERIWPLRFRSTAFSWRGRSAICVQIGWLLIIW